MMRTVWLVIVCCLAACVCSRAAALPADSLTFVHEQKTVAPLAPDTHTIQSFKEKKEFDYYSSGIEGRSLSEIIGEAIQRLFNRLFNVHISKTQANTVFWIVLVVLVIILVLLLFVFKPKLFFRNKKIKPAYTLGEERIDRNDYDHLIAAALAAGNHADAIRWCYLHTLKKLDEEELIAWEANKTVNEYVATLGRKDLKPAFTQLSRLFLYIRYGNFEAGRIDYDKAEDLSKQIIKGI